MKLKRIAAIWVAAVALMACSAGSGAGTQRADAPQQRAASAADSFSADTAYALVVAQTAMGPRTPGSEGNARCAEWMAARLRAAGADTVEMQRGTMQRWDGRELPVCNVLASFNSAAPRRVLLVAHYDTRPWADNDLDPANHTKPVPGANDGASGVGVLLEVARVLSLKGTDAGVDILFVDSEDYGTEGDDGSWALGARHFVQNPPAGYVPARVILLDMVGGRGTSFRREMFSSMYAPVLLDDVWEAADAAGHSDIFTSLEGGAITDDHVEFIKAGIPAIDIIALTDAGFPDTWHTINDNLEHIDSDILAAAGRTVLYYLGSR